MPKIDGFRLCEQIKRIDKEVCFITASEEYYKKYFSELKKERSMSYAKTNFIR
jgi:CheY-like chemotaxis protein